VLSPRFQGRERTSGWYFLYQKWQTKGGLQVPVTLLMHHFPWPKQRVYNFIHEIRDADHECQEFERSGYYGVLKESGVTEVAELKKLSATSLTLLFRLRLTCSAEA
jgi:hypothetical protein